MNYNSHKLNPKNHSHIIGRQDSITGDTIKANDEVVFCSACQSVFLVESWKYMDTQHCNQRETLGFVPVQAKEIKAKKKEDSFLRIPFPAEQTLNIIGIMFMLSCLCVFFGSFMVNELLKNWDLDLVLVMLGFEMFFGTLIFLLNIQRKSMKKNAWLELQKNGFALYKTRYKWTEVEYVVYKSESNLKGNPYQRDYINNIRIHVNDLERHFSLESTNRYPDNIDFLENLIQVSELTKVTFCTNDEKEYKFIEEKKKESTGNVVLTKSLLIKYN
ncbi:hypothetical protein WAF17_05390 [Bernardetia sp. ABR2-2B]|uniref:hypothetical protein n=1 Tax=Bernardetia sp. ABR2-2B TaxID=3127472 RepID=UPI0030CA94E9